VLITLLKINHRQIHIDGNWYHQMDSGTKAVMAGEMSQTDDKAFLVALLKSQFAQIDELGFLGAESDEWLTRSENTLASLDVQMLMGIARGAQNLLLAELISADR
jgi:hypothetical protein